MTIRVSERITGREPRRILAAVVGNGQKKQRRQKGDPAWNNVDSRQSLSAAAVLVHKAMAADGVIVACDGLIGLLVRHSVIQRGGKLRIRESSIAHFGQARARTDSVPLSAMPRHVEDDFVRYPRHPPRLGLTSTRPQLIHPDHPHTGTSLHSTLHPP